MALWDDFREYQCLSDAELTFLEMCRQGRVAEIGKRLPRLNETHKYIRAEFLRHVIRLGQERMWVQETGVQLLGAVIVGDLDLNDLTIVFPLKIIRSRFRSKYGSGLSSLTMRDTVINGLLRLDGTLLGSLSGDRVTVKSNIFLRNGFSAQGPVTFRGAEIHGQLSCKKAIFKTSRDGLNFSGARIMGDVFLDGCAAQGEVRFTGAEIDGDLSCSNAKFRFSSGNALRADRVRIAGTVFLSSPAGRPFQARGKVSFRGAAVGNSMLIERASFLGGVDFSYLIVEKEFRLKNLVLPLKNSDLRNMRCGMLNDDFMVKKAAEKRLPTRPFGWGDGNRLNGFVYGAVADAADGQAPGADPEFRIEWLQRQMDKASDYHPQPWKHLQKTLRLMGHDPHARAVGVAHEEFRYRCRVIGQLPSKPSMYNKLSAPLSRVLHQLYGGLTGYGYQPLRLVLFSVAIWFLCSWLYWLSALAGHFGPTNPMVFQNTKYGYKESNCKYERKEFCVNIPLDNWYWLSSLPVEYTAFSPMAYSLDVILPLVDLGQEKDWGVLIPTPKKIPLEEVLHFSWGHIIRLIVWFEILWGWVASLMLVAVISGMARNTRDDE